MLAREEQGHRLQDWMASEEDCQVQALSMGMHESQSLLWERMVALSPAFAKFLLPRLQKGWYACPVPASEQATRMDL